MARCFAVAISWTRIPRNTRLTHLVKPWDEGSFAEFFRDAHVAYDASQPFAQTPISFPQPRSEIFIENHRLKHTSNSTSVPPSKGARSRHSTASAIDNFERTRVI